MTPPARIPVAVLGATGTVGQRFVALLEDHPWFELAVVAASERSAGRPYADAAEWTLPTPLPAGAAALAVRRADDAPGFDVPLVLSALDGGVAGPIESAAAEAGKLVVTNARDHRLDADVPLVVPEVNADHLDLVAARPAGAGAILANPNCSTIGLALALAPLERAFGVEAAHVVSLQALSGAGRPGVPAVDALGNVVPFIRGEEEKLARETPRVLGRLVGAGADARIEPAALAVSAQCNRVPVSDGHLLCASVRLGGAAERAGIVAAWEGFAGEPQERVLPSAPAAPLAVLAAPDAPQPRRHRDLGAGMTASVGRLAPCPVLGWRFVCLSHNTIRGAAGGALLLAELAVARGLVSGT